MSRNNPVKRKKRGKLPVLKDEKSKTQFFNNCVKNPKRQLKDK